MKKFFLIFFIIITTLLSYLFYDSFKKKNINRTYYEKIVDQLKLNNNNNKNKYLIFFDPLCDPCQSLLNSITQIHKDKFEIIFIDINNSNDSFIDINKRNIYNKKNVDPNGEIFIKITPTIIELNSNNSFQKEYIGITDFNLIINED